jgi:translation elongation factor EF-1beta/ubiquinone/menaquinone biosynthesis C-methylase UbiE
MAEEGTAVSGDDIALLGDPSGRQDEEYWNSWFLHYQELKGKERRKRHLLDDGGDATATSLENSNDESTEPFEWYCSADEVVRVLSSHLRKPSDRHGGGCLGEEAGSNATGAPPLRILHPGSGTSLVPRRLLDKYPHGPYCHVVVDVSPVAIEQAKQVTGVHDAASVEFVVGDLLSSPSHVLFPDSSFVAWIDKGFLDAVFSATSPRSHVQAKKLFYEALRLLGDTGSLAIVVSLAEDHSLNFIIRDGWLSSPPSFPNTKKWSHTLHVHELEPTSGAMRPFAFVLTTESSAYAKSSSSSSESDDAFRVAWHRADKKDKDVEIMELTRETAFSLIQERVRLSRAEFAKSRHKPAVRKNRVRAVLELKPYDPDVRLEALGSRIVETKWSLTGDASKCAEVAWQPTTRASEDGSDGDVQRFEIIAIGFGISKLRMSCVVDADELEELVAVMEEELSDDIQSIDVDWPSTVPVGDARDFLHLPMPK